MELELTLGVSESDAANTGWRGTGGEQLKAESGWITNQWLDGNGTDRLALAFLEACDMLKGVTGLPDLGVVVEFDRQHPIGVVSGWKTMNPAYGDPTRSHSTGFQSGAFKTQSSSPLTVNRVVRWLTTGTSTVPLADLIGLLAEFGYECPQAWVYVERRWVTKAMIMRLWKSQGGVGLPEDSNLFERRLFACHEFLFRHRSRGNK